MANALFNTAREGFLLGEIDWDTATIKVAVSQFEYTDEESQHMAVLAASMNRQEYNYLGFALIGFELITKTRVPDAVARAFSYQDRMFCSQMADFCLRKAGFDLFHSQWGMVSPGDFERYFQAVGWMNPDRILITTNQGAHVG